MKKLAGFLLALLLAGCSGEPGISGHSLNYWIKELKSKDYMTRQRAADNISMIGLDAKEAVPDLIELLHDPEGVVRTAAVIALGTMGGWAKEAVPELLKIWKADPEKSVRESAGRALRKIDPVAAWNAGVR